MTTAPAIAELAQLDQWVISKPVPRRGKIDKLPFSPLLDDSHAKPWMCSHSNPAHWGSYDAARAALASSGFSWLGFTFHEADPYNCSWPVLARSASQVCRLAPVGGRPGRAGSARALAPRPCGRAAHRGAR